MSKTIFHNGPELGVGIYTVKDMAVILDLPQKKVSRVLNEIFDKQFGSEGKAHSWGKGRGKEVNFYTLIEFYVFYQLIERGVKTKRIIQSHNALSEAFHTPYPFAHANFLTDGRSILFEKNKALVSADKKLQFQIVEVIQPFFANIAFDGNHLAKQFYPKGKNSSVIINPHQRFGEPVIEHTNISTESIFSFYKAGESIPTIASLYDISEKQVQDAVNFYSEAA